jgi:hypothetical protein
MEDKILVIAHSILDQGTLTPEKRLSAGALGILQDLKELGVNLIPLPDLYTYYQQWTKKSQEEGRSPEPYEEYLRRQLVPLVNQVMDRVRGGARFLGVLSYRGDASQQVEPENSPLMVELFRLFDRNCMITPYYEIPLNLTPEEEEFLIADLADTLRF